jgi:hypothetical protein
VVVDEVVLGVDEVSLNLHVYRLAIECSATDMTKPHWNDD